MIGIILGLVVAIVLKRNPASILFRIKFKGSYIMIACLLIQILLEWIAYKEAKQYPLILNLTFVGMLIVLFWNRHIPGVSWVFAGLLLNLSALVLHGGLMPVSESAMQLAGVESSGFAQDSRHQPMGPSWFWWLGDWIPVVTPFGRNYVYSPGDVLVEIGLFLLLVRNSKGEGRAV